MSPAYSQVKHLAMALFLGKWRASHLAIFALYGDASGTGLSNDVLTMSGFIATDEQWVRLERRWKAILDRNSVSSLHMNEFAHSRGEYESWKGDEPRRRKFLNDLINEIAPRVRASFSSSVFMPDYRKVDEKYGLKELVSPLALAGCTMIAKVYSWADAHRISREQIVFRFEAGDLDGGNLSDHCKATWGFTPSFVKKKDARVLETADLLSYEIASACKWIQTSEDKLSIEQLRKPLQLLTSIPNGPNGEYWGVHENPMLERRYKKILDESGVDIEILLRSRNERKGKIRRSDGQAAQGQLKDRQGRDGAGEAGA